MGGLIHVLYTTSRYYYVGSSMEPGVNSVEFCGCFRYEENCSGGHLLPDLAAETWQTKKLI
jgi:hypothetical protein